MGYLGRWLPVVLGGVALVAIVQPVLAKTPAEIEAIAKASTVKIEFGTVIGTGVIVHQQGQVYSLVTNRHVVCGEGLCNQLPQNRRYRLSLPDGQQMQIDAKNVQFLGKDLDLAVIRFTSNRSYSLVKMAAPGKLKAEDAVFTAGFPLESRQFNFNQGKAIAVVNRRIQGDKGGYSVIYDAGTWPGMSGCGVFDNDGNLVAIHGLGDKYKSKIDIGGNSKIGSKIGYNRGIPIRWLIQGLGETGIIVGERTSLSAIRVTSNMVPEVADEYFIIGFNKFVEPGTDVIAGKKEAIQQFTKAIQLNPNYSYAYHARAYTYHQVGDFQKSLTDYNKAIALNPNNAFVHNSRGVLKADKLNDLQGALADYNKAISLSPDFEEAYLNRGVLKADKLNDLQGALADYNKAITLNPDLADAYVNRGLLKIYKLNNPQGALTDYNKAITLNPDLAETYLNRGLLKVGELNDPQGALVDFNKAIQINPQFTNAYGARGQLKATKLNDRPGGITDLRQAASLARAQGNTQILQTILGILNQLGATE
jgi:Tfp pilus assembly protein PilF